MQGFYFYFRSLLGMGLAAEFGTPGVIVPLVAHEWARLEYQPGQAPRGETQALSRWAGLARTTFLFYALVGPFLAVFLFFFARHNLPAGPVHWQGPWLCICLFTAFEFSLRPLLSVLEGCQQVAQAFRVRLWQGFLAAIALWIALVSGGGLWSLAASVFMTGLAALWPLLEFAPIFQTIWKSRGKSTMSWSREIWPMQWRLGLASLSCNAAGALVVPIVFKLCGPAEAGRFGLTLILGQVVAMVTSIWVQTKAARLARLVALGESGELHRLLYQTLFLGLACGIGCAVAAECGLFAMHLLKLKYYYRMLPEFPTAVLLLASVLANFHHPLGFYLRAHRFEPFLGTSLLTAGANLALTWLLTSRYGIMGACLAQLLAALVILPPTFLIWFRFRRSRYHTAPPAILDQE